MATRKRKPARAASGGKARPATRGKARPTTRGKARPTTRAAAALARYHAKRDFSRTPEPRGGAAAPRPAGLGYVIQKHAARRLHYDFRLEWNGVLLSWAVPKGPSLSPAVKRLAARTEDHPLDYANFEGIIPAGEYGGGTVVVWDRGTWQPEGDVDAGLKKGHLAFALDGDKLKGRWHLVRTRGDERGRSGDKESWLLFKSDDAAASDDTDIVASRPESVLSGRSIEQVRDAKDAVWHSDRGDADPGASAARKTAARPQSRKTSKPAPATADLARLPIAKLLTELPLSFKLTNLDKVLYPDADVTKGEVIAYYAVMHERVLAQLAGRPLMLMRCPDGYTGACFFQKHATDSVPPAIGRIKIAEAESGAKEPYMVVRDLNGLLAAAQLGGLELHTWGCRETAIEHPDQLVFDLDPDVNVAWPMVVDAALALRGHLDARGLTAFVKTTGGKGLHLVVPVAPARDWERFKSFARQTAEELAAARPKQFTTNPLKARRHGKIFLDYLRNGRGATAVAAYSLRARPGAPVATPISWQELERGIQPAQLNLRTVPQRLTQPDPWAAYGKTHPPLPRAR